MSDEEIELWLKQPEIIQGKKKRLMISKNYSSKMSQPNKMISEPLNGSESGMQNSSIQRFQARYVPPTVKLQKGIVRQQSKHSSLLEEDISIHGDNIKLKA